MLRYKEVSDPNVCAVQVLWNDEDDDDDDVIISTKYTSVT